jgi:hypothetical protein
LQGSGVYYWTTGTTLASSQIPTGSTVTEGVYTYSKAGNGQTAPSYYQFAFNNGNTLAQNGQTLSQTLSEITPN